jgi:hypothetical protein
MEETRVAGVCVLRDARDILPFLCGHYLLRGFDRLTFVDDGSSDGSFEFLTRLSRRSSRVRVTRVVHDSFRQPELVSAAANEAICEGFGIIVPFDADEFWDVSAANLVRLYGNEDGIAFFGRWTNFVQQAHHLAPRPGALLDIRYRARPMPDADGTTVPALRRPFVGYSERKVGVKTASAVEFARGQHNLVRGPADQDAADHDILHIPLRYRSEIDKRALNYEPRRQPQRGSGGSLDSWQSAFHAQVVRDHRGDEIWAANSADGLGYMHLCGERIPLVRDDRIRRIILRSGAYLMMRFGLPPV